MRREGVPAILNGLLCGWFTRQASWACATCSPYACRLSPPPHTHLVAGAAIWRAVLPPPDWWPTNASDYLFYGEVEMSKCRNVHSVQAARGQLVLAGGLPLPRAGLLLLCQPSCKAKSTTVLV